MMQYSVLALVSPFFFTVLNAEPVAGYIPAKGEVRVNEGDKKVAQWGEDVAAHTYGPWQFYKPNEFTMRERKNSTFWVNMLYHGGWRHGSGFQPKAGQFRVTNAFGVWEHDPKAMRLNFRFVWPGASRSSGSYDSFHDCYWQDHQNGGDDRVLIRFRQEGAGLIRGLKVVKSTLGKYRSTDVDGRIRFDEGTWATMVDGELRFFDQRKDKREQPVANEVSVGPPSRLGPLRNGSGFGKQFPECGVSFKILTDKVEWFEVGRDGRGWIHAGGLYCLDFGSRPAPTYDEFLKLLPVVFGDDSIKATHAMHRLLQARQYKGWIREELNSRNAEIREAARALSAAMNGGAELLFNGYYEQWNGLKAGKGKPAEGLPLPEANRCKPFVETDPLILNLKNAGYLRDYRLVDSPLFEPKSFQFRNSGSFLHSPGFIRNLYLKVEGDGVVRISPMKSVGNIYNIRRGARAGEALAHIKTERGHQAGVLDIKSGAFAPLASLEENRRYHHMAIDDQKRMVMMYREGGMIGYQTQAGGELIEHKLEKPKQTTWGGGILWQDDAIFLYRPLYRRQWDGKHSEIKAFWDGELVSVNDNLPGHIYHLSLVSEEMLLVATRNPSDMFFVNATTGEVSEGLFELERATQSYTFLPDALTDAQGRFWVYTNWVSGEQNNGRLQVWDGEQLETFLEWQFPVKKQSLLNPYMGNMTLAEDGKIWLAMHERMLVVDAQTLNYRFFRVPDRLGIPVLNTYKNMVMGRYKYASAPAVFSLEKR